MPSDPTQPIGTPCWLDLQTDLDRARDFYGAVLGWQFQPFIDGWEWVLVDGARVAAIGAGEPRDWQIFLRTDAVADTVAKAESLGGSTPLPPGEVGAYGSAAIIAPPGGAPVGLWQAGSHPGFTTTGAHGTPVWFETNTWQADQVEAFYAALFDLSHERMEGMDYRVFSADGAPRYGVLQMTDDWKGMDPSWMAYFGVDDTDAGIERVTDAGGQVLYGAFDTPFGRMAVCKDPMGSAFSIIQPTG